MSILKPNHSSVIQLFLYLIAVTVIFRKICTIVIIVFALYCLLNYKKMEFPQGVIKAIFFISIPFLLEILFFWNNSDLGLGGKSLEKSLSSILFPVFILGNYKHINFYKLLRAYSVSITLVLVFFLIRYYFVHNQFFLSFYYGMNMWQMGYHFSNTIGIHAPALNMHIAFVSMSNLFFLISHFKLVGNLSKKINSLVLFLTSFAFLLIINTRIALLASFLCYLIILFFQFSTEKNYLKKLKITFVLFFTVAIISMVFVRNNDFMKEKYSRLIFDKIEMVGRLDEIERPEVEIFSSLATRLTIWKTTLNLAKENLFLGVGSSDGKNELFKYYEQTGQKFLSKHKLPVHNQYLDYLLKFGLVGLLGILIYMGNILYLGIKLKNALVISFFTLFALSNMTDDFLIRFDGIVFSGFWITIFTALFYKNREIKKSPY